jgi:hypothetical protein
MVGRGVVRETLASTCVCEKKRAAEKKLTRTGRDARIRKPILSSDDNTQLHPLVPIPPPRYAAPRPPALLSHHSTEPMNL